MLPGGFMGTAKVMVLYTLVRYIDFTNPDNVFYLLAAYATAQATYWLCMAAMYAMIQAKGDKRKIKVHEMGVMGQPNPGEEPKIIEVTVCEYYTHQLQQLAARLAIATTVVVGVYYKFEVNPPLFMQIFLNGQQVYSTNLFKILVLGHSETKYPLPWDQPQQPDLTKFLQNSDDHESRTKKRKQTKELEQMRKANLRVQNKSK